MNHKKLLKSVLLGIGTAVTASNTVFAISFEEFLNNSKYKTSRAAIRKAVKKGHLDNTRNELVRLGIDNPD